MSAEADAMKSCENGATIDPADELFDGKQFCFVIELNWYGIGAVNDYFSLSDLFNYSVQL